MRLRLILLILFALQCYFAKSQTIEKKEPLFNVKFSGMIKTDFIFDTRQTVNLREGSLLFYPEPVKPDADGKDINAKSNFNILAVQTKLTLTLTGPDALGAKTSGLIEAEFFGNVNPNINVFRLRHAYIKLNWPKTELLIGQYWHPMYEAICNPEVISADAGLPFKVYARNPQIRLSQNFGNLKLILSAMTQIDFTSNGPEGPNPKYLRNSILPELNFQIQYLKKDETNRTEFMVGAGIDYLMLTPALSSEIVLQKSADSVNNGVVVHYDAITASYKTNSHSQGISGTLFTKIKLPQITFKLGGVYSDNGYALSMIGGYAVKSITDSAKRFVDYANIRTFATWMDVSTNGTKWQAGLFGGYSKNLGAGTGVIGPFYSRGSTIDYLYRISGRFVFIANKLRFGPEIEYTVAAYGKTNEKGYVYDAKEIGNLRILLGVVYFF
jgi:hypothetical protein